MSSYDEIRRDSIEAQNRAQDRADFSRAQRDQTAAVHEGIRTRNESMARTALGVPPAGSTGSASSQPLSVESQFARHTQRLLSHLKWCDVFPRSLLLQWESNVLALDAGKPRESLRLVAVLSASYDEAKSRFEPPARDLFPAMRFADQAPSIAKEIHHLIQVLERISTASAAGR